MIHQIIPEQPPITNPRQGEPVNVAQASRAFGEGRVVGYTSGNVVAALFLLSPHEVKARYGFCYLRQPHKRPCFVSDSVPGAIRAAMCSTTQHDRRLFMCASIRELLDRFDASRPALWRFDTTPATTPPALPRHIVTLAHHAACELLSPNLVVDLLGVSDEEAVSLRVTLDAMKAAYKADTAETTE